MAARFTRRTRPLLALIALGTTAVIAVPTIAAASPTAPTSHSSHSTHADGGKHGDGHSKPTIASVQKKLGHLVVKNSHLVEQFDRARVTVGKREKAASAAHKTATKAAATYSAANSAFTQVVQSQYESGGFSGSSGALLTSENSNSYLDTLSTMDLVSSREAQIVKNVRTAHHAAAKAFAHAHALLVAARSDRRALATKRTKVKKQIASFRSELAKLNAQQQAEFNRTVNPSVNAKSFHATAPSAAAQRAVNFAISQIGKPYVFGADGPSTYDCSGLTMRAWEHGGVSLPHSAIDQYNYGTHVTRNELEPGDLIFFYQPIGHVTIYVGDGMMVSAPETGEDVSLVPLSAFSSDYAGATHLK
ncbi:C40 family peptidase [Jatrophihabitans endophyticus]|uniref:C40 family peptidase n=1 Tax=Jatrophihabitans endophyticus TaxID=1206085 RepID=UPI001A06E437|nr:C40 family peptidase [Jatrophihabitans endophyticus]MBE7189322.1 C40 family peptidase [Jatrophihabitans endophyticus]